MKQTKLSDFESFSELSKYRGSHYDSSMLDVFDTLVHKEQNHHLGTMVEVDDLKPGMIVNENLFGCKLMLLLGKGHVLTAKCIENLKQVEGVRQKRFLLDVNLPE